MTEQTRNHYPDIYSMVMLGAITLVTGAAFTPKPGSEQFMWVFYLGEYLIVVFAYLLLASIATERDRQKANLKIMIELLDKSGDSSFKAMVDQMKTNPDAIHALYGDGGDGR
jgi:hypothetical protein